MKCALKRTYVHCRFGVRKKERTEREKERKKERKKKRKEKRLNATTTDATFLALACYKL